MKTYKCPRLLSLKNHQIPDDLTGNAALSDLLEHLWVNNFSFDTYDFAGTEERWATSTHGRYQQLQRISPKPNLKGLSQATFTSIHKDQRTKQEAVMKLADILLKGLPEDSADRQAWMSLILEKYEALKSAKEGDPEVKTGEPLIQTPEETTNAAPLDAKFFHAISSKIATRVAAAILLPVIGLVIYILVPSDPSKRSTKSANTSQTVSKKITQEDVDWLELDNPIRGDGVFLIEYVTNFLGDAEPSGIHIQSFKCTSESCDDLDIVKRVPVNLFENHARICFEDTSLKILRECLGNFSLDGQISPPDGFVIELPYVLENIENYYLIQLSTHGDTYVTKHDRVYFTTEFTDWGFATNIFDIDFIQLEKTVPSLSEVTISNDDGKTLIDPKEAISISLSICSPFTRATDYVVVTPPDEFSDSSAEVELRVRFENDTDRPLEYSWDLDLESSTCIQIDEVIRLPDNFYDADALKVSVSATSVDNQDIDSLSDVVTKTLFMKRDE